MCLSNDLHESSRYYNHIPLLLLKKLQHKALWIVTLNKLR